MTASSPRSRSALWEFAGAAQAPALSWPVIAVCLGSGWLSLHLRWLGIDPQSWSGEAARFAGVGAGCLVLARARRWDREALGLVARVRPDAGFWARVVGAFALFFVPWFAAAALAARAGFDPFGMCEMAKPWSWGESYLALVHAPLWEEALFRFLLCGALLGRVPPSVNIAFNGALFALAHIVYGGIGPDSLVGGFMFAWGFLRSGTILVPLAMHFLGNLALVLIVEGAAFHWLACATP